MQYCKECDRYFDEIDDNLWVERDGDAYDPRTRFWYCCPFCGEEMIDEDEEGGGEENVQGTS